jgi:hypothetical protein
LLAINPTMRRTFLLGLLVLAYTAEVIGNALQTPVMVRYQDPRGRFAFSYPATFGATSPGMNDGFQDRVAAISFSAFPARFKGEAVLTRGFPLIDLQAVGGLYDVLLLEIFPDPLRAVIISALPRLSVTNFCQALEQSQHIDLNLPTLASLSEPQRQAIGKADMMRNANPHVIDCQAKGNIVVFDKERSFAPGTPAQHVYGAVRFLPEPLSTFQLIAGGDSPEPSLLAAIADLVATFKSN